MADGLNADGLNAGGLKAGGLNAGGLNVGGLNVGGLNADGLKGKQKGELSLHQTGELVMAMENHDLGELLQPLIREIHL
ncbi:MAG: hypothetical protein IJ110_03105, partial [Lachnospiraceae bacterium]|nr:hypothetical protein [Lachnospiraceae bacterium]